MKYVFLSLLLVASCAFAFNAEDVELTVFTYTSDNIPEHMDPNRVIGERTVDANVVYDSDKYTLRNCRNVENKENKKGFYVAQLNNTDTLVFYCGTKHKRGDKIKIILEEGI